MRSSERWKLENSFLENFYLYWLHSQGIDVVFIFIAVLFVVISFFMFKFF